MADANDPRLQPGAYVRQGRYLYEVLAVEGASVTMENCKTDYKLVIPCQSVTGKTSTWGLVRGAPEAPDTLAGLEAA